MSSGLATSLQVRRYLQRTLIVSETGLLQCWFSSIQKVAVISIETHIVSTHLINYLSDDLVSVGWGRMDRFPEHAIYPVKKSNQKPGLA